MSDMTKNTAPPVLMPLAAESLRFETVKDLPWPLLHGPLVPRFSTHLRTLPLADESNARENSQYFKDPLP